MDLQTVIAEGSSVTGDVLIHDPSRVVYSDGYYYMYSTGHGVRMRRSKDLIHWKLIGSVFNQLPEWCRQVVPGKNESSLWAPDIIYFKNLYHLYYSVSTWGSNVSAIGLAVNPVLDPAHSDYCWTDCGPVIISNGTDYNAIDPCPIFELPPSHFQGEGWGEVSSSMRSSAHVNPQTHGSANPHREGAFQGEGWGEVSSSMRSSAHVNPQTHGSDNPHREGAFQGEGWGEVSSSMRSSAHVNPQTHGSANPHREGAFQGKPAAREVGRSIGLNSSLPGGEKGTPFLWGREVNRLWLVFGSFFSGIKLIELDPATGTRMRGDTRVLPLASRPGVEHNPIEAPYLLYFGGYYYLFTNWDFCCRGADSTYNIRVARSREITGPYLDKDGVDTDHGGGSLFLTNHGNSIGPGQFGFIDNPLNNNERLFVYHYYDRTNNGRSTLGINRLRLDPDGWPVVE